MASSPLRLQGIPRIEGLQVKGFWASENDEFILIADTLKEWQRNKESLAKYTEDAEHTEEILQDLYRIRDWVSLELRREKSKPPQDQAHKFIERREYFLNVIFPYEEGQLLAWEPTMTDQDTVDFVVLQGRCTLLREQGRVVMILIESFTGGDFSVFWKQAGDRTKNLGVPIRQSFSIGAGKTVAIRFTTAKEDGVLNIYSVSKDVTERIPF